MKQRLSTDRLPIDGKEWTVQGWKDLHEAIEKVKLKVRRRHQPKEEGSEGDSERG